MGELHYCKKCGNIKLGEQDQVRTCETCNKGMYLVPDKYLAVDIAFKKGMREEFIEKVIKSNEEFSEELFLKNIESERKSIELLDNLNVNYTGSSSVKCPYCSSGNVAKIGMTSRLISTGLFGLGSNKIGKQWHCNGCGSNF